MTVAPVFPFAAIVGQDDAKLALRLAAADPAKTSLARGLAALLPGGAPFVELPLGATEDRVVGSIDLAAALTGGGVRFSPGLLAAAHGGVLYVDEVNLLADHLVDVLLDVAVSGVNRVEREGVAHTHSSRFVLVGSMNPEEGELRPQLLDRFGLAVDVVTSVDPAERAEAVQRRLAFDADPDAFCRHWAPPGPAQAHQLATFPGALVETVSRLCVSVGAEGLRADLVICRAAAALAGLEGREEATVDDVRRVAPLALAHRRRQRPFDDPGISAEEIEDGLAQAEERSSEPDAPAPVRRIEAPRSVGPADGRRSSVEGTRGRLVGDRAPQGVITSVATAATIRTAATRRHAAIEPGDVREAVREQRAGNLVVLAVDASGSMGAQRRMEAAKGAVLSLLLDAYQRRDRVAMLTFRGDGADVVLRPTGSVEVAKARLADLPTGGRTPLAAGILAALDLAERAGTDAHRPLLVLITDGRATAGDDALSAAHEAAGRVRRRNVPAIVVDAEDGPTRLGLATELARAMGARLVPIGELSAHVLRT